MALGAAFDRGAPAAVQHVGRIGWKAGWVQRAGGVVAGWTWDVLWVGIVLGPLVCTHTFRFDHREISLCPQIGLGRNTRQQLFFCDLMHAYYSA
eukprot:scaffold133337_cov63-Phaeocystis_antarctica.AAC.2